MINFAPLNFQDVFRSLIIMLGLFGMLALLIHIPSRNNGKKLAEFNEEEREANMANNKPLPKDMIFTFNTSFLDFYKIDYSNMDPINASKLESFKKAIISMNNLEYVYPQPDVTNTELKFQFGPATLQKYINLEQHYSNYTQKLIDFSQTLFENNLIDEAEYVINELLNLKCSTSKPYITLIDIYLIKGEQEKITNLKNIVENSDLFVTNEYCKKKILDKIHEVL